MTGFDTSLLLLPVAAALAWTLCRTWYGRRIRQLEHRFGKVQADRETLQEHLKQARQQLAQLQKDLSARQAAARAASRQAKPSATPARVATPVSVRPEIPSGLVFEPPAPPSHGFADTMPFADDTLIGATG